MKLGLWLWLSTPWSNQQMHEGAHCHNVIMFVRLVVRRNHGNAQKEFVNENQEESFNLPSEKTKCYIINQSINNKFLMNDQS